MDYARNCGVTLDSRILPYKTMHSHLPIGLFISVPFVHAIVTLHLDYCNNLLTGLPLQSIQITAANAPSCHVTPCTNTKKSEHITPHIRSAESSRVPSILKSWIRPFIWSLIWLRSLLHKTVLIENPGYYFNRKLISYGKISGKIMLTRCLIFYRSFLWLKFCAIELGSINASCSKSCVSCRNKTWIYSIIS